jgi:hypothetical protein
MTLKDETNGGRVMADPLGAADITLPEREAVENLLAEAQEEK